MILKILKASLYPIILFYAVSANAQTMRADCQDLKGTRVDYAQKEFKKNVDGVTNSRPQITYDFQSQKGYFISTDAAKTTDSIELIKVASTDHYISFMSILNGAPVLMTIYPKDKVLIYNEQAVMKINGQVWPKAKMFWAECDILSSS
jgi:hypothetical protein